MGRNLDNIIKGLPAERQAKIKALFQKKVEEMIGYSAIKSTKPAKAMQRTLKPDGYFSAIGSKPSAYPGLAEPLGVNTLATHPSQRDGSYESRCAKGEFSIKEWSMAEIYGECGLYEINGIIDILHDANLFMMDNPQAQHRVDDAIKALDRILIRIRVYGDHSESI